MASLFSHAVKKVSAPFSKMQNLQGHKLECNIWTSFKCNVDDNNSLRLMNSFKINVDDAQNIANGIEKKR